MDKKITLTIVSVIIILGTVCFLASRNLLDGFIYGETRNTECISKTEDKVIQGDYLQGLIEDGEKVRVFFGYYDCNPVEREDIVLYNYSGEEPLIKIVKAVPGDAFSLESGIDGGWNIIINGQILNNSQGEAYSLDRRAYNMLYAYEDNYGGVVPDKVYMIMGNQASGSFDFSKFGLVHESNLLAKAEIK
jgi:signal peptidase I